MSTAPKDRLARKGYPRTQGPRTWRLLLSPHRAARLTELAEALGIGRAVNGRVVASAGSLIDALATGHLGICRMDDPQKQIVQAGGKPPAVPNPRCPGDWD